MGRRQQKLGADNAERKMQCEEIGERNELIEKENGRGKTIERKEN
jgi:hypothetical protein